MVNDDSRTVFVLWALVIAVFFFFVVVGWFEG